VLKKQRYSEQGNPENVAGRQQREQYASRKTGGSLLNALNRAIPCLSILL
jgi:hypothetical protein